MIGARHRTSRAGARPGRALALAVPLALLGAGCAELPRDPERTIDRIRERGTIRLGMVAAAAPDPRAEAALAAVAGQLGARIERHDGHGEDLLAGLDTGRYDIVYGRFADGSPWAGHVHLGTPPGWQRTPGKDERAPRFAFRNGENGWIMRVEAAGR